MPVGERHKRLLLNLGKTVLLKRIKNVLHRHRHSPQRQRMLKDRQGSSSQKDTP